MSLTALLQQYVKPSRWWRRHKTIQVTIWPRFLAQALCPHIHKQLVMWDVEKKTKTYMCLDCHKNVEERNDCAHGEVHVHGVETVNNRLVPFSYVCEHCQIELERKDLPPGATVTNLIMGK
jgi:Zn ribbon nucleic-acid-binding protein